MNQKIPIVQIRNSTLLHCWVIVQGTHEVPIRRGMYGENVPASMVMREVMNAAIENGGPVKVQIVA